MAKPNKLSWHRSNRWCFTKTVGAKRQFFYADPSFSKSKDGERKARLWMEGLVAQLDDSAKQGEDWSLNDLRRAYLSWCKRRLANGDTKQHTYDGHRKHLGLICRTPRGQETYGAISARELTTKMVGQIIGSWRDPGEDEEGIPLRGKGPTTIRNRIGSLQAMLNWAASPRDDRSIEKLIAFNPIRGYELPKAEYQGDRYAPAEEVEAFLAWVDKRAAECEGAAARFERLTAKLVHLIADTGARPGEICALEWRHFDPIQRTIVYPPREHKTGGKTKRPRIVVLGPDSVAMLLEIKADVDKHPTHVFTHATRRRGSSKGERTLGDPWNSNALSRKIKELRRGAIADKVPLTDEGVRRMHLYRLRHTHITAAMQDPEKPAISDVATMHGTSVKMIENTYLHHQVDHLHGVLERMQGNKPKPPLPSS